MYLMTYAYWARQQASWCDEICSEILAKYIELANFIKSDQAIYDVMNHDQYQKHLSGVWIGTSFRENSWLESVAWAYLRASMPPADIMALQQGWESFKVGQLNIVDRNILLHGIATYVPRDNHEWAHIWLAYMAHQIQQSVTFEQFGTVVLPWTNQQWGICGLEKNVCDNQLALDVLPNSPKNNCAMINYIDMCHEPHGTEFSFTFYPELGGRVGSMLLGSGINLPLIFGYNCLSIKTAEGGVYRHQYLASLYESVPVEVRIQSWDDLQLIWIDDRLANVQLLEGDERVAAMILVFGQQFYVEYGATHRISPIEMRRLPYIDSRAWLEVFGISTELKLLENVDRSRIQAAIDERLALNESDELAWYGLLMIDEINWEDVPLSIQDKLLVASWGISSHVLSNDLSQYIAGGTYRVLENKNQNWQVIASTFTDYSDGSLVSAHVADGDETTDWASMWIYINNGLPQYIGYDFGGLQQVSGVQMRRSQTNFTGIPEDVLVEISQDGQHWQPVRFWDSLGRYGLYIFNGKYIF